MSISIFPAIMVLTLSAAFAASAQETPGAPAKKPTASVLKQPVAPDIVVGAVWDGRGKAPFKAIDNPPMVKADKADFLEESDYVLGVTVNGESRAYPTRYVWFHHAVNDTFAASGPGTAEKHVAITYCSVCNTGVRYDPVVNGKTVMFDFYGLYNGIVALCDRETESVILQAEGRVINGPLMGTKFKSEALLDTTWGQWKQLHPATMVMSPDTPYTQFYSPKEKPEPRGYTHFPAPYFRPTVTRGDLRLPPFDKVLAVTLAASTPEGVQRRAYPIKSLILAGGLVNESIDANQIAVFYDDKTAAAVAVSSKIGGRQLHFEWRKADGKASIYDRETGSVWNIEGVCESGKYLGKSLERLDCHLSQWYGWSAYFPDTSIYGRTDPPKPGNPFEDATPVEPASKP